MASQEQSLLVVEDELALNKVISKFMERQGFRVLRAADGVEALAVWEREQPDLIMLDLILPGIDGFEVCRRVRKQSAVPIIVMTASNTESDKLAAFALGADDYVTKPFLIEELRARVSAVLRRSKPPEQVDAEKQTFGRLTVNLKQRKLWIEGEEMRLTPTEWSLLEALISHADTTMSHHMLLRLVWDDSHIHESKSLRTYIGRLRRKIEENPTHPTSIVTEPGMGYRFVTQRQGKSRTHDALRSGMRPSNLRIGNLPIAPISLIGRDQDIRRACDLLRNEEVRLLTLTGAPGVGKTRLGHHVALQLIDRFPGGCFQVDLTTVNALGALTLSIARTLGVREGAGQPLSDRLKHYLRDQQVLLMLDNFEQVLSSAALVSDLLTASRGLKILVTSRSALGVYGEHEMVVAPLALPSDADVLSLDVLAQCSSVSLFLNRARAAKQDFGLSQENAPIVAAICRRLDGLPLAIELAAAQVKVQSPQTILSRLNQALQFLIGGARDLPSHQQTLRGAIDRSYMLLDNGEQALFARLGVFDGGCTLEAVRGICTAPNLRERGAAELERRPGAVGAHRPSAPAAAYDGLMSLLNKNLIYQVSGVDGQPRFMLFRIIREYAEERLFQRGELEMLRRRHASYFLRSAEMAEAELRGSQVVRWLDQLEEEHDNFRLALRWALDRGEAELALRMGIALSNFWGIRGYLSDGLYWLDAALTQVLSSITHASLSPLVQAQALIRAAFLANLSLEYDRSNVLAQEGLSLSRQISYKEGIGLALLVLARNSLGQADGERSQAFCREGLAVLREIGLMWAVLGALHVLTGALLEQDDYAQAEEVCEEGVQLAREIENIHGLSILLVDLGEVLLYRGQVERAYDMLVEGLSFQYGLRDRVCICRGLTGLAKVAVVRMQPVRAVFLCSAADALRSIMELPPTRRERMVYDQVAALLHTQLDQESWHDAWMRGQALQGAQVLDDALAREGE